MHPAEQPRKYTDLAIIARQSMEDWPPTLQRFVHEFGAMNPVDAAQIAAKTVMDRYAAAYPYNDRDAISVRYLCKLLDIDLRGNVPKMLPSRSNPRFGSYGESDDRPAAALLVFNRRATIDVAAPNPLRARISVAHEIGHFLIHSRGQEIDNSMMHSEVTTEEEILSEYIGRLLLLPTELFHFQFTRQRSMAVACITAARDAAVSFNIATSRISDPDQALPSLKGAIFWRLVPGSPTHLPVEKRLAPFWHLCPNAFVPIRKCHARHDSVIA